MKDEISQRQQRVFQYDYVDGTPDLAFGGLCLLMTICYAAFAAFPDFSNTTVSTIIFWVVFAGGGFLIGWLPQRLKERVTFPRTGYVAHRREGRPLKPWVRWTIRIGVPLISVILLVSLFLNRSKFPAQSQDTTLFLNPGLTGLLFTGIWVMIGWKVKRSRYYLIAAISLLISFLFFLSGSRGSLGMAVLSGAMCLILFISGGLTLWKYLRKHPISQDGRR